MTTATTTRRLILAPRRPILAVAPLMRSGRHQSGPVLPANRSRPVTDPLGRDTQVAIGQATRLAQAGFPLVASRLIREQHLPISVTTLNKWRKRGDKLTTLAVLLSEPAFGRYRPAPPKHKPPSTVRSGEQWKQRQREIRRAGVYR